MLRFFKKIRQLLYDIWKDRRLLLALTIKDFRRRFAGSYFGAAWGFIQPLLTIIVYWAVFQFGFRSGDVGEIPFPLWFICGIIPWLFVSEAFSSASNSFLEYSYLVKKVIFNIDILPLVKVLSSFVIHLFFILLLFAVSMLFGYFPTLYTLQIFYYAFCLIFFTFSISLIFSAVMVFFRDLAQIIGVLLLIGMWGSPIAWNISIFPEPVQFFLKLNPVYYLVDGYRDCFVTETWFWQKYNLTFYFWLINIVLFFIGAFIYNRLKPHFADVL